MQTSTEKTKRNSDQLQTLEALELPFICVDSENTACYLSAKGAQLLEIPDRDNLSSATKTLSPFVKLAETSRNKERSPTELSVRTYFGLPLNVIAEAKQLQNGESATDIPAPALVVIFHDISLLQPFFSMIEQSKRARSRILLAASCLAKEYKVDYVDKDSPRTLDLLPALSKAIDIVDPLILPTVKMLLKIKTSLLIDISETNFLRLFSHLLLEASDFVGPIGIIKIRDTNSEQTANQKGQKKTAEVVILAHRQGQTSIEPNILEHYIFDRCKPIDYGLDENLAPQALAMKPPGGKAFDILVREIAEDEANYSIHNSISSENMKIAVHIAKHCEADIRSRVIGPNLLLIYSRFSFSNVATTSG